LVEKVTPKKMNCSHSPLNLEVRKELVSTKVLLGVILLISLSGCYNVLHYGYLPGGHYKYYAPITPVDLQGQRFRLEVIDGRRGFNISCWPSLIDRNTELEGATGYDFFSAFVRAMIEANHGVVDPKAEKVIRIELTGLSAHYQGYGYVHVYGLVEFNAFVEGFHKNLKMGTHTIF
jgi:hypothetical protein